MKLSINIKILLLFLITIVVALVINSFIYFQNLRFEYLNGFYKQSSFDISAVESNINSYGSKIVQISNNVSLDKQITSIVNLIANYQDKSNYNSEFFDDKKKKLLELMDSKINSLENFSYNIIDKNHEPIIINEIIDLKKYKGIFTYKNEELKLLDSLDNKSKDFLFTKRKEQNIGNLDLNIEKESFSISYSKPIYNNEEIVGYFNIKKVFFKENVIVLFKNLFDSFSILVDNTNLGNIEKLDLNTIINQKNTLNHDKVYDYEELLEDENYFYHVHILNDSTDKEIYLISAVNKSEFESRQVEMLINFFISIAIATLISFMLIGIYLKKSVFTRINTLSEYINNIKDKKYTQVEVSAESPDEIDEVILELNHLTYDLKTSFEEIRKLNQTLEQKVEERTEEQNKLLSLFEQGDSVLFRWNNDENWTVDYVSSNVSNLMGYTKEEFFSKEITYGQCVHKDDIENLESQVEKALWEGNNYNKYKPYRIVTKDGLEKWVLEYNTCIKDENGDTTHFLGYVLDITANQKIHQELENEKQKAEEATRAKSEFLANMSHEIRTPMNGIIGMSQLSLKTDLDDKQRNYINKINISANTLLGIINDILDLSKIEAGKLEIDKNNFDLFKIIDSVINLVELKAQDKNIDITVQYDPSLGKEFYGDSLRINQILTNLLGNAVKFTDQGEIGLVIKKIADNRVRFEVKDTGIGLTKEQMNNLFKSFSQADSSTTKRYGGTGLGLAISKQLVEMMNGVIQVESELGIGSTFSFEIDLEKKIKEESYDKFTGKKVLIVDDCQSWLDILSHLMKSFGLEVDTALSGETAIELLKEKKDVYDLFLIDWNMPNLDGIETCKIIESELGIKSEKIILISSYSKESLIEGIKEAHINHYLHKPVNPSALNDMLSEIFQGKIRAKRVDDLQSSNYLQEKIKTLKGSKILLVEDNLINQEIILELLKESGIEVDIASNGYEGIQSYLLNSNKYELILMDIQMPVLDGYEATKEIREDNKDIPIIALTANAMKEDVEKTKNAGMNEHLSKPIDVRKLYNVLLKYLTKKTEVIIDLEAIDKKEENFDSFNKVDSSYGLKLVMGNHEAYNQILKGIVKYKDVDYESLEAEEFRRTMHSLKGLSASAGAEELSQKAKECEKSLDKKLLFEFKKELNEVVLEVETYLKSKEEVQKKIIDIETRNKLFDDLKEAISTKRAKNTKPIIKELERYELEEKDKDLFENIKNLTNKFKFKEALELL